MAFPRSATTISIFAAVSSSGASTTAIWSNRPIVSQFPMLLPPNASIRLSTSATRSGSELALARPWSVHLTSEM
jgi:hypothetical protein